eukprot:12918637-Prorocentrum_lima.AAC.1
MRCARAQSGLMKFLLGRRIPLRVGAAHACKVGRGSRGAYLGRVGAVQTRKVGWGSPMALM